MRRIKELFGDEAYEDYCERVGKEEYAKWLDSTPIYNAEVKFREQIPILARRK